MPAASGQPSSVPFVDLKAQLPQIYNEIDDRFTEIVSRTGFVLGPQVEEFEAAFAELQGARHCVGLSSGTDAIHAALMALGIGPGDEVIVPVNTFFATAEAVSLAGATPVFVDSDESIRSFILRAPDGEKVFGLDAVNSGESGLAEIVVESEEKAFAAPRR